MILGTQKNTFIIIVLISLKLAKDSRYNEFKKEVINSINDQSSKLDQKENLFNLIEYLN